MHELKWISNTEWLAAPVLGIWVRVSSLTVAPSLCSSRSSSPRLFAASIRSAWSCRCSVRFPEKFLSKVLLLALHLRPPEPADQDNSDVPGRSGSEPPLETDLNERFAVGSDRMEVETPAGCQRSEAGLKASPSRCYWRLFLLVIWVRTTRNNLLLMLKLYECGVIWSHPDVSSCCGGFTAEKTVKKVQDTRLKCV